MPDHKLNPLLTDFDVLVSRLDTRDNAVKNRVARIQKALAGPAVELDQTPAPKSQAEWDRLTAEKAAAELQLALALKDLEKAKAAKPVKGGKK